MSYSERRTLTAQLIDAGRRLDDLGLVPSRDGNLSARLGGNRVLVTATGVRKRSLTPEQVIEVDLDGRPQGGGRASTELGLHLAVYRAREDVRAVVHAHPPTAVGFAVAGEGLTQCLMPETVVHLGAVPLTPYATPGTPELEAAISPAIREFDAFLLANHGAVTMGSTVDQALDRMETVEHTARITLTARLLGGAKALQEKDIAPLVELRRRMGNPRTGLCTPAGAEPPAGGDTLVAAVTEAVLAALASRSS